MRYTMAQQVTQSWESYALEVYDRKVTEKETENVNIIEDHEWSKEQIMAVKQKLLKKKKQGKTKISKLSYILGD